ncbi:MAG: winged helix-turn-helix domain-containing protein [Tepidiformaceae bacterium]
MTLELTSAVMADAGPLTQRSAGGTAEVRRAPSGRSIHNLDSTIEAEPAVAFVVATREYRAVDVITGLFGNGFSAIERAYDEIVPLLREFSPTLIVAAMDPMQPFDREMIAGLAEHSQAFLLLLAPSSDRFAAGLTAGADACLSDVDGADVLSAQFRSIRRRASLSRESRREVRAELGPLVLDFEACKVWCRGQLVGFTPMEYSVLAHLVHHRGAVCSPVKIVYAVLGEICDERVAAERIKAFIWRIRVKLKDAGATDDFVTNFRGVGYLVDDAGHTATRLPA